MWSNDSLAAAPEAKQFYSEMIQSSEFQNPLSWTDESHDFNRYDALFLVGGHAQPMKQLLESLEIRKIVVDYFEKKKP